MFQYFMSFIRSKGFKLTLKFLGSLTSAILVVSGYILFRTRRNSLEDQDELDDDDDVIEITSEDVSEEEGKGKSKVHFLFKDRQG